MSEEFPNQKDIRRFDDELNDVKINLSSLGTKVDGLSSFLSDLSIEIRRKNQINWSAIAVAVIVLGMAGSLINERIHSVSQTAEYLSHENTEHIYKNFKAMSALQQWQLEMAEWKGEIESSVANSR